jgi:hypothetical protein
VRFKGLISTIECQIEPGGAIRFHLNDSGLADSHVEDLEAAFADAFNVPIGQSIDPTTMVMGVTEIYQHLLSGVDDDQVRPYQREHLQRLIDAELLTVQHSKVGRCTLVSCTNYSQRFTDESVTGCPSCQTTLRWEERRRYKLNPREIHNSSRRLLQKFTGRKLSSSKYAVESHKVHRLFLPKKPNKFIHVFFNEHLRSGTIDTFRRAMFPMMIVHPTSTHRIPVIDSDGIAHFGFPHALAVNTNDDGADIKDLKKASGDVIRRLMQMEQERVLKAARFSRDSLVNRTDTYNDQTFESDVYNLLRRVFANSIRMGGANRPDGFVNMIYYEDSNLRNQTKVNLSYDAKYSDTTYDFGIGEHRQMHEYIRYFTRVKTLQRSGSDYDGHIIIDKNINDSAMQNAANYLWNEDRLPKIKDTFVLVFMHCVFLTRLWDLIGTQGEKVRQRWYSLAELIVGKMRVGRQGGYCVLNEDTAEDVIRALLLQEPIEDPINEESLLSELKERVKARINQAKGPRVVIEKKRSHANV